MLEFRDVPSFSIWAPGPPLIKVPLPSSSLGTNANCLATAKNEIASKWKAWFEEAGLPSSVTLPVGLNEVAGAMSAASCAAMPFNECTALTALYLKPSGAANYLEAKLWVERLPSYHRRTVDEVLGVGLSLAAAIDQGYIAFATREVWIKSIAEGIAPWNRPWKGDGPDYVMEDGKSGFAFIEIKGRKTSCPLKPVNFALHKAQSLNAKVGAIQARHMLSYAHIPCGTNNDRVNVRWFNATATPRHSERIAAQARISARTKFISLAIAHCHFKSIIQNAGYRMNILSAQAPPDGFDWAPGEAWLERSVTDAPRLLLPIATRRIFQRTETLFQTLFFRKRLSAEDRKKIDSLHEELAHLRKDTADIRFPVPKGMTLRYRYSNGACIVSKQARDATS